MFSPGLILAENVKQSPQGPLSIINVFPSEGHFESFPAAVFPKTFIFMTVQECAGLLAGGSAQITFTLLREGVQVDEKIIAAQLGSGNEDQLEVVGDVGTWPVFTEPGQHTIVAKVNGQEVTRRHFKASKLPDLPKAIKNSR